MQAHITSNIQQQNTLEIQHQTKFYLDTRRSHIPESKQAKFQQLKWAEQGDRKIRAQEQQEHRFEFSGRVWLGERKGKEEKLTSWGARWDPRHMGARPTPLPRRAMAWQRGGSPWSAPGTPMLQNEK